MMRAWHALASEAHGPSNLPGAEAIGELDLAYPGGLDEHMRRPESEGHTIVQRTSRHFVEDLDKKLTGT